MKFISEILLLSGLNVVVGHFHMASPAPRGSKELKGYKGRIDYFIDSPILGSNSYPCRGFGPGVSAGAFKAGSAIPVSLEGTNNHDGGHCQFSISYDDKNFAVLKTVMGNCITGSSKYDVPLPNDAPNGKATFAWTWISRSGSPEFYMNCADIEITGGSNSGKITGQKVFVARVRGFDDFPNDFKDDYGTELYAKQPIITVSPSGNSVESNPKQSPIDPKTSFKPSSNPSTNPIPMPTSENHPKPEASNCISAQVNCLDSSNIAIRYNKVLFKSQCPYGTQCKMANGEARCL